MASKLTEEDLEGLRAEWARGGSPGELAVAYGISERHVRRLCVGVERHLPRVEGSVTSAVEQFLDGLVLDGRTDSVLAETARLVACRLDKADGRTTPALAERLIGLCHDLAFRHREPDALDDLVARREARLLAAQVGRRRQTVGV
jgi:hypothetical protein